MTTTSMMTMTVTLITNRPNANDNNVNDYNIYFLLGGDVVAQMVERPPRNPMDSMTRGSNLVQNTRNICESFPESKCCADSSVCPVCTRTHKNVRTLKIL